MASAKAKKIAATLNREERKMGDIKKMAKEIKKDHDLAVELWSTGDFHPRLLSTLIFDKKLLSAESIELLAADMLDHDEAKKNQMCSGP